MKSNKLWRIYAKALGEKAGATNKEADQIAIVRTVFVVLTITAEICIIANVIHQW